MKNSSKEVLLLYELRTVKIELQCSYFVLQSHEKGKSILTCLFQLNPTSSGEIHQVG